MNNNVTKLYAAYKAGFLGEDLLETYFSFFANIIIYNEITVIDVPVISRLFCERYGFELPDGFIRQVLGIGEKNGSIVYDRGKYISQLDKIVKYKFDNASFNKLWNELISAFKDFCKKNELSINENNTEKEVLQLIDETDEAVLSDETAGNASNTFTYAWFSFAKYTYENNNRLFDFISALCASNITKQALFYTSDKTNDSDYAGLSIYLDTPMVFALLGMDDPERTKSYKKLISRAQEAGCSIFVLNHNFQEIEGILAGAAGWAISSQYDIAKANNATRFFHDHRMSKEEIVEYCNSVESQLNDLGITQKVVNYDVFQNQFQEDEEILTTMVKEKYAEQNLKYADEKEHTIQIDIRSIILIYRMRCGQVATRIKNANHIMLTSNNAIANVSKKFESNKSINSGHIPACISADLFAAVLWLSQPTEMQNYNKHKLLADCYCYLKPTPAMISKYTKTLDDARNADEIDEKKYLFLRTHPIVLDTLMNVIQGDYARFNDKTYLEVYDEIMEKSRKEYLDEAQAHKETKEKLKQEQSEKEQVEKERNDFADRIKVLEKNERDRKEKKARIWGWVFTGVFCFVPYIIFLTAAEIIKAQFTESSCKTWLVIGAVVISTIAATIVYNKGKAKCFNLASKMQGLIK